MNYLKRISLVLLAAILLLGALLAMVGEQRYRSDIYAWFPDGRVVQVSPQDTGSYYQACISPDGTNVIFGGASSGPPQVWRAELPAGGVSPITPPDSAAFHATYRLDGQAIVFSSDRAFDVPSIRVEDLVDGRLYRPATRHENHRNFNLFVMDPHGGAVQQVTHGEVRDLRGTFTPDGERLTFYSTRTPRSFFWTMPADGSEEPEHLPLTGGALSDAFRPWYTVDGESLYFFGMQRAGEPPYRYRILHAPAEGGDCEVLPFDDFGRSQAPYLDPNGGFLLFHNNRSGRAELYELPLGTNEARMLRPPGLELAPGSQVMHPTRARNGTLTFDLSSYAGSPALIWLRSLRETIVGGSRWRWNALFK